MNAYLSNQFKNWNRKEEEERKYIPAIGEKKKELQRERMQSCNLVQCKWRGEKERMLKTLLFGLYDRHDPNL
jgi:hypothetical protein